MKTQVSRMLTYLSTLIATVGMTLVALVTDPIRTIPAFAASTLATSHDDAGIDDNFNKVLWVVAGVVFVLILFGFVYTQVLQPGEGTVTKNLSAIQNTPGQTVP